MFSEDTPPERAACEHHDEAYWYGGTVWQRYLADRRLYRELLDAGASAAKASAYYVAVRMFGAPWWYVINANAWSYGGSFYRYEEAKA
jgi:hypothetical protein